MGVFVFVVVVREREKNINESSLVDSTPSLSTIDNKLRTMEKAVTMRLSSGGSSVDWAAEADA